MFKGMRNKGNNGSMAKTGYILRSVFGFLLVVAIVCGMGACEFGKKDDESTEGEKLIAGMTPEVYKDTIKSFVEAIYVPKSEEDFRNMRDNFLDYAAVGVWKKFTAVGEGFDQEEFDSEIYWKDALFADGAYQKDGADRLYYEFEVIRHYRHYNVRLEFVVTDGKLTDYQVY